MRKYYEIFFQNSEVSSEEWALFFKKMKHYQKSYSFWKLYLVFEKNYFRFYIETNYFLPCFFQGFAKFFFQECHWSKPFVFKTGPTLFQKNNSFLEFYESSLYKKKRNIFLLEFSFSLIKDCFSKKRAFCYFKKSGNVYKSPFYVFQLPLFLSFQKGLAKFLNKKIPKYLNIQKQIPIFQNYQDSAFLKINTFPYMQKDLYISLKQYDFAKHSLLLGSSGCGKSKLLCSLIQTIYQDEFLKEKYRIVVLDPHADLKNDIGGLLDSLVIDFKRSFSSIQLFSTSSSDILAQMELYLSLFRVMLESQYNPKLERVLRFSLQLLLQTQKFTFENLRLLLLDTSFREKLLRNSADISARISSFFLQDYYDLKTKYYNETIAPILAFLDEMQSIPVFANDNEGFSLDDLIQNHFLTLISLNRNEFGDHIMKVIAGFLMCQMMEFIEKRNHDFSIIFIVDEVSVIENPILTRMLSETRKFGLSLFLVSQYFNQISKNLQDSILANVINYYVFRISYFDASLLVDSLKLDLVGGSTLEDKIQFLTGLGHRELVVRFEKEGKLMNTMKVKTMDVTKFPLVEREVLKDEKIDHEKKPSISFVMDNSVSLRRVLEENSTSHRKVRNL